MISLIALFVALGGTSYAVLKLPPRSVGNRELKRDAVTASKIRNGSIGQAELADGVGVRGPRGPQGPPGTAGAPGTGGVAANPEPWKALPFEGAWTSFDPGGWAAGEYRKDQNGVVYLRGMVTKTGTIAADEAIARMPVGYRPPGRIMFIVGMGQSFGVGRVDVMPGGDVVWKSGPSGEPDYTSLETIRFWPN